MYSGSGWFNAFYNQFVQARKQDRGFGLRITSQKYTQLMKNFLKDLGRQQGFEVETERLTIDQLWKHRNEGNVAVEHEISPEGIFKKELRNLMDISSDLKVLITYVYDYQFPWEPEKISENIEKEINEKYGGKFKEFVLLVGTKTRRDQEDKRRFMERGSDWFARRFCLNAVKKYILIPSSSQRARRAWQSRRHEKCRYCSQIVPTGQRRKHLRDKHGIKASGVMEHFDIP